MSAVLSRRAALSGAVASVAMVGAGVAGAAAVAPVAQAGVSPALAALIATADAKETDYKRFQIDHLRPADHQAEAAKGTAGHGAAKAAYEAANERFDALVTLACQAQDAIGEYPTATPVDFCAKVAFLVRHNMFEGYDRGADMLADATRLAKMEG